MDNLTITKEGEILSPVPENDKVAKELKFKSDLEKERWKELKKLEKDLKDVLKDNADTGFIIQGRAKNGRLIFAWWLQALVQNKCLGKLLKYHGEFYIIKRLGIDVLDIAKRGMFAGHISFLLERYAYEDIFFYNIKDVHIDNTICYTGINIPNKEHPMNIIYNLHTERYGFTWGEIEKSNFNNFTVSEDDKKEEEFLKSKVDKFEPYKKPTYTQIKFTKGTKVIFGITKKQKSELTKAKISTTNNDYLFSIERQAEYVEKQEKHNDIYQGWGII